MYDTFNLKRDKLNSQVKRSNTIIITNSMQVDKLVLKLRKKIDILENNIPEHQ